MVSYPLSGVPGTHSVKIEVYQAGDPRANQPGLFTLAELRDFLGGDEGGWPCHATGELFHASLKPYIKSDTPGTRYKIQGHFSIDKPVAPAHQAKVQAYLSH